MEPSGSTPIIWRSSFHFGYHDTLLLRTQLFTHERWPHYSCWCHTGCTHRQAKSNLVSYSFLPGNTHLPCEEKALLLLAPWQPILFPQAVDTKWGAPLVLHGFCLVSLRQDCPHSRQTLLQPTHFFANCKQVSFILFTTPCLCRKIFMIETQYQLLWGNLTQHTGRHTGRCVQRKFNLVKPQQLETS